MNLSRVMVIGCPGSGKTTFSDRLAVITGRQAVHLDKLLWLPGWNMIPYEERRLIHDKAVSQEEWLIDGMWRSHLTDRIKRATAVIFLDYKRYVSLFRAIKRRIKFSGKQRDDIAPGCPEKLDKDFLNYIWRFKKETRPQIYKLINDFEHNAEIVIFKKPSEAEMFLRKLVSEVNAETI